MRAFLTKAGTGELELIAVQIMRHSRLLRTFGHLGPTTPCDKNTRILVQTDVVDAADRSQASMAS